jgi:cellulose synthase/poly-beta-1,6-N-acetylglucosamine synthase-like glycosyltransferase
METQSLRYTVVTPVRNEVDNLHRVARCLREQTARPLRWVVVDTGSTDETVMLARRLAEADPSIEVVVDAARSATSKRGGPIVRAFESGIAALAELPEVVVKLDADVSFGKDYFERLLRAFEADPTLGIASGSAEELEGGRWRTRYNTGSSVWGAARAYRRECLEDVRPLEQRMGWDGIDEMKANVRGWRTATLPELTFRHHRPEGGRDRIRSATWALRGAQARYMGYRPTYLVLRAVHHMPRDPAALLMIWGFFAAGARREPTCADEEARSYLRDHQRLRNLKARGAETRGRRPGGMVT